MSKIIGIDLGTSTSCVCVVENGAPKIIENSEGKRTTPSFVAFTKDGEIKVGDPAKRQAITNPKNTVYEIKRFMGNTYAESEKEAKRVTYDVIDDNGYPKVNINDKKYTPQEMSAKILQKMKKTAEDYLGEEVKECVVTVPAYFNDSQRQATKDAAAIAGMECKRIINEPTAAAIAYGLDKTDEKERNILVFDTGGGTHDTTILNLSNGVFEVLATDGDTHLGGADFDQKLIDWLLSEFKNDEGIDISKDPMAVQRLKEASEKAKIELSTSTSSEINLPYISAMDGVPKHLVKTITRAKFEQLTEDLVKRTIAPCKRALKGANLKVSDIDEVILVGGSTRIPAIQEAVKKFFKKEPNHSVNPDEAVAQGAAIQGGILNGDDSVGEILLLDVCPLNLGLETMGNVMTTLIEANTTIPTKKTQIFSTAVDNQPAVSINVLQGNRPMAADNRQIGMFTLDGIAPAQRGVPQIEVTFDIDANGILSVSAVDKATGKEQKITIEASSNLSDEDIKRMQEEAKENEEADKKKKEETDKINEADTFIFHIEKSLKDFEGKGDETEKKEITDKVELLKKAVSERNLEDIEKYNKELHEKWDPFITKIYQENAPNGDGGMNFGDMFSGATQNGGFTNAGNTPSEDDTIDAETVE